MAYHHMLRRASSSPALRTVASTRTFHSAIPAVGSAQKLVPVFNLTPRGFVPSPRFSTATATIRASISSVEKVAPFLKPIVPSQHFSTETDSARASDEKLIRVIESEIDHALESIEGNDSAEELPNDFPFEIEDNPGDRTIVLARKFGSEIIKVEVDVPNIEEEEDGEDDESESPASLPIVVTVSRGSGHCLEFGVTAYLDEICIDSFSIKKVGSSDDLAYEGPDFSDLDENLQKGLHKYLETRGIKPSVTNFLKEYMDIKENKEYLAWLKNLKNFIGK